MRDDTEVVRCFWEDVWTQGQADLLNEIVSDDALENEEPFDVPGFINAVGSFRGAFPDFSATVEELTPTGDGRVLSRVTYRGTQRGTFHGLPATGRSFSVIGIDIFTISAGRITQLWHTTDHLDMVYQLGAKLVLKPEVQAEFDAQG